LRLWLIGQTKTFGKELLTNPFLTTAFTIKVTQASAANLAPAQQPQTKTNAPVDGLENKKPNAVCTDKM
jgi:hypothetical protein